MFRMHFCIKEVKKIIIKKKEVYLGTLEVPGWVGGQSSLPAESWKCLFRSVGPPPRREVFPKGICTAVACWWHVVQNRHVSVRTSCPAFAF